jgi:hypothetical protein
MFVVVVVVVVYDLTLSWRLYAIKSSQATSRVKMELYSILTQLVAQEDFIAFSSS